VYNGLGDRQQALTYYQQALPIMREVGDRAGEATTLNNIGAVYDNLGDRQQALAASLSVCLRLMFKRSWRLLVGSW
jgi:tetratricopeptide (TPR) repeat protein